MLVQHVEYTATADRAGAAPDLGGDVHGHVSPVGAVACTAMLPAEPLSNRVAVDVGAVGVVHAALLGQRRNLIAEIAAPDLSRQR